jgi:hypothetical protein
MLVLVSMVTAHGCRSHCWRKIDRWGILLVIVCLSFTCPKKIRYMYCKKYNFQSTTTIVRRYYYKLGDTVSLSRAVWSAKPYSVKCYIVEISECKITNGDITSNISQRKSELDVK